jgi:hypothetical protein
VTTPTTGPPARPRAFPARGTSISPPVAMPAREGREIPVHLAWGPAVPRPEAATVRASGALPLRC